MKKAAIFTLFLLMSGNSVASDYSYDVSGEDENGRSLNGTIDSNSGERNVSGELTDENGNTFDFDGQWSGKSQVTGELDDGTTVDLNID